MSDVDSALQRLLRSARDSEDPAIAPPFGFETRVVALWRAGKGNNGTNGVSLLVRRVAIAAALLIVVSSAAFVREFSEAREIVDSGSNEFAIADSAIETELNQ